jgi:hypothetical protein
MRLCCGKGRHAVDAAIAAVKVLEDARCYNAGCGSVLNAEGYVQMDASVMHGIYLLSLRIIFLAFLHACGYNHCHLSEYRLQLRQFSQVWSV